MSTSNRYISEDEAYGKYKHFLVDEGDLVIASSGIKVEYFDKKMGFIKKAQLPLCMNTSTVRFKALDKEKLNIKYFMYFLKSHAFKEQLFQQITGSAQLNFGPSHLKKMLIPLVNINTQLDICTRLNKVVALIEQRQQQLTALDELISARFVEMFGEIGTDIHGWGLVPFEKCCEINPKKTQDKRLKTGLKVSFIPMTAVGEGGELDSSSIRDFEEVKTGFTYFAENDVLFAKITPCMENGKGTVAKGLKNGVGFGSTEFHVLRPLNGISNPYWIYVATTFIGFRKSAEANMTGSAGQRRVPVSFFQKYRISIPPIKLQEHFAAFVTEVDKSKLP